MTAKFPFEHFIKIDDITQFNNVNDVLSKQNESSYESTYESSYIEEFQDSPQNIDQKIKNTETEFSNEELQSITDALLDKIKIIIGPSKFHAFFNGSLTISAIKEDKVEAVVSTSFIKKIIETKYQEAISSALFQILGKQYILEFQVIESPSLTGARQSKNKVSDQSLSKQESLKKTSFFIDELEPTKDDLFKAIDSQVIEHENSNNQDIDLTKTFSNFVIGSSNNIAHALALAVAKDPGKSYPALYIFGNSGLGKTHLVHAIANSIQVAKPNFRISLTSANRFMNEMVESIKKNQIFNFKKRYTENTDVLIIDDIHELKNKTSTQDMFFHIFNELISKGKQLVFTSDKTPKEITGIEDRIRTRLSSALPVEIQQPDLETRIAILKKKAIEKDIYLSDDVVNLIAKCVKSNIRELEGCLIKLGAVTSILKVDIDLEVAKEHLKLNEDLQNQKNLTMDSITKTVASYYKIPIGDIRGKSKTKEVVLPRQIAMYFVGKLLKPTLKDNGQYFSGRDHSTVLHAIKNVADKIKNDKSFAQQVQEIEAQL